MSLTSERIKQSRKDIGLTLQELGNLLQVNKGTISKWEKGVNTPKLETIARLAEFLEVDMGYLLGSQKERRIMSLTEFVESTEENQLIYHYRHLTQNNQTILKQLAAFMVENQ